jgi:hypothetical protein
VQINIYSSTGRLVSATHHRTSGIIELSLANQPEGLYLLRIITGQRVFDRKVVLY